MPDFNIFFFWLVLLTTLIYELFSIFERFHIYVDRQNAKKKKSFF